MSTHDAHRPAPLGGPLVTPVTVVLAALVLVSMWFMGQRFLYGFSAATNISDGYTWGIWVAYDIVIGTAFACGGYSMALLTYVFNKGEYHPLVRPALLASLFGYTLGGISVILDVGRYWNLWHVFWPSYAQPNSVMFEVAVCISLYILVLWIEFSPAFLERLGLGGLKKLVERLMFLFIALGVLLPSMHQSSLGTLLVVFGHQVDPLWQTPFLPVLFIISAITMGFCIVVFEASLAAAGFKRPGEQHILARMVPVVLAMLAAYLVLRFAILAYEGKLALTVGAGWLKWMFWAEIALFALPFLLIGPKAGRMNPRNLFLAALSMLLAGALYRLDAFLVAYHPFGNWSYFPSAPEILVTVGIIAFEVLAYIVLARQQPVLPRHAKQDAVSVPAE